MDHLLDNTLTLTPDTRLPTDEADIPPDLPPKLSRRQHNGAVPNIGNGTAVPVDDTPPVLPRRKKEQVTHMKENSDAFLRSRFGKLLLPGQLRWEIPILISWKEL